jgi:hypothetical protein
MSTIGDGDPRRSDSLIRGFRSVDADHCFQKAAIVRRKVVVALVALKHRTPRRTKCHLLHHPSRRTIPNAA